MLTGEAKKHPKAEARLALYRRYSAGGLRGRRVRRRVHGLSWVAAVQSVRLLRCALDLFFALALLSASLPLLLAAILMSGAGKVGRLKRTPKVGRWGEPFDEFTLNVGSGRTGRVLVRFGVHRLPALLNIVKGDMSLVGPRAAAPGEMCAREMAVRKRQNVRPGLVCLWWIRKRANIDYGSELGSDTEYVESRSVRADLGIAVRAIPSLLYGGNAPDAPDEITVLGIPVNNLTMSEAVELIAERLDSRDAQQVCFVNPDCANIAYRNDGYMKVLRRAALTFADGIGMKLAGKLSGQEIKQNVNGTDLFPRLCARLSGTGRRIFLLGARPGIAEAVREWVAENYPAAVISGCHHGYFTRADEPEVVRAVARSRSDLLLVAFGAPRQDMWIAEHLAELNVRVAMGVGGLFDFYSGRINRAPQWVREMGLEWIYRFLQEPHRMWRRYFVGNGLFLYRVLKERRSAPPA